MIFTNHTISLKCIITENQLSDGTLLHFDWFKNNKLIQKDGITFNRTAAHKKDTGRYVCRATVDGHTRIVSKAVSVIVVC